MTFTFMAVAVFVCAIQLCVVAAHPEPPAEYCDGKTSYARMISPRFCCITLGLSVLAGLWIGWADLGWHMAMTIWCSAGLVLVSVDAVSTWMPIRAHYLLTTLLIGALCLDFHSRGLLTDLHIWLTAIFGGAGLMILFAAVWWFTGSLGFGDVRLAFLVGMLGGAGGLDHWMIVALCGTTTACLYGLVTSIYRHKHPSNLGSAYAYGPGLWAGPLLAALLI